MYNAERDECFDGVGSYAACGEPRENYAAITGFMIVVYTSMYVQLFFITGAVKQKPDKKMICFEKSADIVIARGGRV